MSDGVGSGRPEYKLSWNCIYTIYCLWAPLKVSIRRENLVQQAFFVPFWFGKDCAFWNSLIYIHTFVRTNLHTIQDLRVAKNSKTQDFLFQWNQWIYLHDMSRRAQFPHPRRPSCALRYNCIRKFVQTSNIFVFLRNAHIDQNINILWKVWGLHNLTMWYSWQLQIQIQILGTWCAMKGNMFSKEVGWNEKPSDRSIWGWGWSPTWWGCNPTWRREHVQVGTNSRDIHDDCSCTGCLVAEIPPPEEILEFSTGFCSTKRCRGWSSICGSVKRSLWAKMCC